MSSQEGCSLFYSKNQAVKEDVLYFSSWYHRSKKFHTIRLGFSGQNTHLIQASTTLYPKYKSAPSPDLELMFWSESGRIYYTAK